MNPFNGIERQEAGDTVRARSSAEQNPFNGIESSSRSHDCFSVAGRIHLMELKGLWSWFRWS